MDKSPIKMLAVANNFRYISHRHTGGCDDEHNNTLTELWE
jgi:hypothetical protein